MINHTLHNVTMLKQYKHRQVVLNFYESDMLIYREGFFFEEIIIAEEAVMLNQISRDILH